MTIEEWEDLPWWKQRVYAEGINDHIMFEAKLAGAKFGGGTDGGDDSGTSSSIPITGDIGSVSGVKIERVED